MYFLMQINKTMKKIFAILVIATLSFSAGIKAQDSQVVDAVESASELSEWEQANTAYSMEQYDKAIKLYEQIIQNGTYTWELYFNLGSAYYKDGQIGRAILNYERALRLDPSNEDIEHNLAVVNAQTKDRIESVPRFLLFDALANLRDSMRPNSWVAFTIVFFVLTVIVFVIWYTRRRTILIGVLTVLGWFTIISYGFAHSAYSRVAGSNEAVVLNTASVVRSSPNITGKELFILHSGTKVDVENRNDNYTEIEIASGAKGWILSQDIEEI